MNIEGTVTKTEKTFVSIDPLKVIDNLYALWIKSLPDAKKIERINMRTGMWVYEEGDYHSDWDVDVRKATDDEIKQYESFSFMRALVKELK